MNTKSWCLPASILAAALLVSTATADDGPGKPAKGELKWKSVKSAVETSGSMALPPGHPTIPMGQLPAGHPPMQGGMAGMGGGEAAPALPEMGAPPKDRAVAPAAGLKSASAAGVEFLVGSDWKETPKDKLPPMRAGVFEIPATAGDSRPGTLVVYHFGKGQGGGVAPNITRWVGQLENPGKPRLYQEKVGDFTVTELLVDGTIKPSSMGGPAEAQPDSSLYGVIIEGGPQGSLFMKITGSKKTVAAVEPIIAALANSVKKAPAEPPAPAP